MSETPNGETSQIAKMLANEIKVHQEATAREIFTNIKTRMAVNHENGEGHCLHISDVRELEAEYPS